MDETTKGTQPRCAAGSKRQKAKPSADAAAQITTERDRHSHPAYTAVVCCDKLSLNDTRPSAWELPCLRPSFTFMDNRLSFIIIFAAVDETGEQRRRLCPIFASPKFIVRGIESLGSRFWVSLYAGRFWTLALRLLRLDREPRPGVHAGIPPP